MLCVIQDHCMRASNVLCCTEPTMRELLSTNEIQSPQDCCSVLLRKLQAIKVTEFGSV